MIEEIDVSNIADFQSKRFKHFKISKIGLIKAFLKFPPSGTSFEICP